MPSKFSYVPYRSSQDHQSPGDPQNSSKSHGRRGSVSGHEPRLLVKRNSGNGGGEWKDVDVERRSRGRSNSTPPDNRHHHPADHRHRPAQDGQTGFAPVSADESWAYGQRWVNTWWSPGRAQVQVQAQVQVSGQWGVRGGTELREGRGRRSSDTTRLASTPTPATRRVSTPFTAHSSLPVVPGVTATSGMGLRKLLRKSPNSRPKILFYDKDEPYYGFTNFSPHPVTYRGKSYPTSEHLFQSFKFTHKPNLMEHIRTCDPRPSVAFTEARRFAHEVHPNWKHENIKAMEIVLHHKFTQNSDLKRELLTTGDAELIENSPKDSFWGCGPDGKGRNELGKALERLRKQLRG